MRTIVVSRPAVIGLLLTGIFVIVGAFTVPGVFVRRAVQAEAKAVAEDPAGQAAALAVETILTVHYTDGYDAWVSKVCAASSQAGCEMFKNVYAPALWSDIEQTKLDSICKAEPLKKVDEWDGAQVWLVHGVLKGGLGDMEQDVYVIVEQEDGGAWKFAMLPMKEMTKKYEGK